MTPNKNSKQYKAFILWASKFNFDDALVDEHCTFNSDRTVDVERDIDLSDYHYAYLPAGLRSVTGNLNLSGLTSAEGLKLPKTIGGGLDLWSLIRSEEHTSEL